MYKEGQIIKCTVLHGSNEIISKTMVDYLKVCAVAEEKIPIPTCYTDSQGLPVHQKEEVYLGFAMQILDGELKEHKVIGEHVVLSVVMTAKIVKI